MLPETYDPSFLIDLVYGILQRDSLWSSLSESVKNRREWSKRGWDKSPNLSIILIVEQDAVVEWALLR